MKSKLLYVLYIAGLSLVELGIIIFGSRKLAVDSLFVFVLLSHVLIIFRLNYCTQAIFNYLKKCQPGLYEKNWRVRSYAFSHKQVTDSLDEASLEYLNEQRFLQKFLFVPLLTFVILSLLFCWRNGMLK